MLKISFKNKLFLATIIAVLHTIFIFNTVSNAASYYIKTVFDEGSFGLITQIITDNSETSSIKANALERQNDVNFSSILDYKKVYTGPGKDNVPGSSLIANIVLNDAEKVNETYDAFLNGDDDTLNKGLLFTFPGLNNSIDTSITYVGTSADAARAELVGNTLTKGLNDALSFIKTYSKSQHVGGEGLRHIVAQLARITSQFPDRTAISFNTGNSAGSKGFTVHYINSKADNKTIGGKTIKIKEDLIPVNDLNYSDYAIISTTDNKTGEVVYGYFPWKMEKGYWEGGRMADYTGDDYTEIAEKKENKYITWGQLAMQAGVNADLRDTTSVDSDEDTMTLIEQSLGTDLTSTINSVRSLLNLAPIQELILNMGSRSVTHYYGVMTQDMYNTSKIVYAFVLAVSLLFLGVLIVRMIHHKMISTTNIIAKTSLMEGLQDIVFIAVMLAIFPGIFELLLELNYHIVKIFSFSDGYLQAYGITGAKVLGMESLAGFMVSSIYLSIDAYINTTYLVRAIVVSFLYAISPIMTVSYAWGSMQKKLYFSYLRELVGNIFMQSFHAVTMTFFSGYNTTNLSAMEAIASAYCFIPITQLFRSLVVGSQGGFSEQLGGKLAGQLTNTAIGVHKSNIAMRQSKELSNLNAENALKLSTANFKAELLNTTVNIIGNSVQQNLSIGEIANSSNSSASNSNNSSKTLKGTLANATMSVAGSIAGGALTGAAEKNNRERLGEMQMKHSVENIGVGLAQAGIGLGISSFDAGTGGGMINSGMGSVERGASGYGQGESNSGEGGTMYAFAVGAQTADELMKESRKNMRNKSMWEPSYYDNTGFSQEAQIQKEKTKGLDLHNNGHLDNTANYIGMRSVNGELFNYKNHSPITKIEAHSNNTNNVTIELKIDALNNASQSDALVDLANKFNKHRDYRHAEVKKATEIAHKKYGVSKTISPAINDKGNIVFVLENISDKLALEVDEDGKTYASSEILRQHLNNKNEEDKED